MFYAIKKTETRVFNPLNNQISFERKLNDILHFFQEKFKLRSKRDNEISKFIDYQNILSKQQNEVHLFLLFKLLNSVKIED